MPNTTTDRRGQARTDSDRWQTSLTSIAPNSILIRGYAVDEMMGRLSFAEAVYLLLMGELPSAAIGRMLNAILVSSLDHGVTPPSTLAARNVATSGAPLKDCVAAGILAFGLAGLGCSALLPLTISFGQKELPAVSAAVAGGVIAFYQLGYGIAAFGVGPLVDNGVELPTIYAFAALIAAAMGLWSFVVARRRPAPSVRPVPG